MKQELSRFKKGHNMSEPKKRNSAITLGAKHAARTAVTRSVKDMAGHGILGSVLALIARDAINKSMK